MPQKPFLMQDRMDQRVTMWRVMEWKRKIPWRNQRQSTTEIRIQPKPDWPKSQYFTTPHAIHMDFTGLHYILDHIHKFGLHWTVKPIQYKTGLHWTPLDCQYKTGLYWTPLDCQPYTDTKLDSTGLHWTVSHILTQNWIPLDSTGLSAIYWHKTGLYWTVNHILTQNWTPLDCQHKTGIYWTPLDYIIKYIGTDPSATTPMEYILNLKYAYYEEYGIPGYFLWIPSSIYV